MTERPRSRALRISLAVLAVALVAGFSALGTWQLFRLQWKRALIERVEARVHADVSDAPGRAQWPQVNAEADEYRHVRLSGVMLSALTTQVLASTERGTGYWLLTPMCTQGGGIVMINRGFVPSGEGGWKAQPAPPLAHEACADGQSVTVTGLLRIGESGGQLLRQNQPERNFWYTRDVQAIARARGLPPVAPYFIDVEKGGETPPIAGEAQPPVAGMTMLSFPNNHLVYAITWFALAVMSAGAAIRVRSS